MTKKHDKEANATDAPKEHLDCEPGEVLAEHPMAHWWAQERDRIAADLFVRSGQSLPLPDAETAADWAINAADSFVKRLRERPYRAN